MVHLQYLKKLDFFREIQDSVSLSVMEIVKFFTEMFFFLTNRSTSVVKKIDIGR